jgi:thiamine-monophosphate kinase
MTYYHSISTAINVCLSGKRKFLSLESYFISLFSNKYIGDDAVNIDKTIYSKDAFFEDVHFKKEWISYKQVAQKAMFVNISDAIAMGAKPKYALLSVAMPKTISKKEMKELADGFKNIAKEYGIEIIGGDTISNTKLDITITIISHAKRVLYRKGLRDGYLLAYTGHLGSSAKELKKLFNLGKIHKKSKFVDIQLRETFIQRALPYLKAGMDISDGLFSDLEKMTALNRVGVKFLHSIANSTGCSGEEYEMLVAFDKRDRKALLRRAAQSRTELNIFAKVSRNRYKNRCRAHHF